MACIARLGPTMQYVIPMRYKHQGNVTQSRQPVQTRSAEKVAPPIINAVADPDKNGSDTKRSAMATSDTAGSVPPPLPPPVVVVTVAVVVVAARVESWLSAGTAVRKTQARHQHSSRPPNPCVSRRVSLGEIVGHRARSAAVRLLYF